MSDVNETPTSSEPGSDKPEGESPKRKGLGCIGLVALVIGLPVACTIASMNGGSDDWEPTAFEARTVCEEWVKEKLKAPSTAKFQDGSESGTAAGFTITGTVDAQNSFGAALRSSWSCEIRYDEASEEWRGNAWVS